MPGTTRDRVSETIQIEGVPLHVIDTAGLRHDGDDEVERIGIVTQLGGDRHDADSVLFLHDLTRRGEAAYEAAEAQIAEPIAAQRDRRRASVLHVHNKLDLALPLAAAAGRRDCACRRAPAKACRRCATRCCSVLAGMRCPKACSSRARATCRRCSARASTCSVHWRTRHRGDARWSCWPRNCAWRTTRLGEITGAFTSDDLLGEIFGRFCIGK